MYKFIIGTFLFLGAGFYQMSGGASFVPHAPTVTNAPDVAKAAVIVPFNKPVVSRAALDSANITAEVTLPSVQITADVTDVPTPTDTRKVAGNRVNLRSGPGVDYGVLDTLTGGTPAQVINTDANGWARIRVTDTGQIGWMAEQLLTDS